MPAEAPGERALLARVLAEDPLARAARRANERWVTHRRVWSAIAREGIEEDGERARFIATRLWPDLPPAAVDAWVRAIRDRAATGRHLAAPRRAEDVVGEHLANLMRAHGYRAEADDTT